MKRFLRDLFFHLKRTVCLFRRRHLRERIIGDYSKHGFRTAPLYQCAFCAEMWLRESDSKRLGGRKV